MTQDNKIFESLTDEELMAVCIYGEARSQGLDGMLAIGSVIVNRSKKTGGNVKSIVLTSAQFSCFNEQDPNRGIIEHIARDIKDRLTRLDIFKHSYWIAKGISEGFLSSNVGPSTAYHRIGNSPEWNMRFVIRVGDRLFYA